MNQALKNQEVEFKDNDKMAKGVSKTKTFNIIYRREYEKTKPSKETDNVDFINPSIEKIFRELFSTPIVELILFIREEKQISELKISSPKFLIDKVMFEVISSISLIIK